MIIFGVRGFRRARAALQRTESTETQQFPEGIIKLSMLLDGTLQGKPGRCKLGNDAQLEVVGSVAGSQITQLKTLDLERTGITAITKAHGCAYLNGKDFFEDLYHKVTSATRRNRCSPRPRPSSTTRCCSCGATAHM